jgi:hypothetical protein
MNFFCWNSIPIIAYLIGLFQALLQFCDFESNSSCIMRSFSQFLLHFAMNVQLLLQMFDFFNQLSVLEDMFLTIVLIETPVRL